MVPLPPALTLISGPAGGGKSRWAEQLASTSGLTVVYLATGPCLPDDAEWQERLRRHRFRRPAHWLCREVEGALAPAIVELQQGQIGLIDSLGTWVAAHLELDDDAWAQHCGALETAFARSRAPLLLVCEEVGWGLVPPSAAGGRFRNRLPPLQRRLADRAEASWLVLQGRALDLRSLGLPVDPD
ncbi:MAG: bifunctional adenosylcobinamide kinase/adenosylcobinamide-phosphate guanylyltransferase [Synechococcaceae cyanobacterium]|nr:bifunctional adenosylcobinamide kinase/adenosylcobinamide-phosphate guanylyltransferase [Synechococcaceae cyanobacterium]